MSSKLQDDIVNNFREVTNCSEAEARRYLENVDWNEEDALALYFDANDSHNEAPSVPLEPISPILTSPWIPADSHRSAKSEPSIENFEPNLTSTSIIEHNACTQTSNSSMTKPKAMPARKSIISEVTNASWNYASDNSDLDEEGQNFYVAGSGQTGQEIIGPKRSKENDRAVAEVMDAARKQGATENDANSSASSIHKIKENAFTGVGHSLVESTTSSTEMKEPPPKKIEQIPIRFYSNGFTVGDGELRKFEDNYEFCEYLKRGQLPPELRKSNKDGQQVEVRLEDHRTEEYKYVPPAFKPFGGTGHVVGLTESEHAHSKSNAQSSMSITLGDIDTNRLEQLAEYRLKSTSSFTTIRLRLPDISTPISIRIGLNRTLNDLREFINENIPAFQSNEFEFLEPPSTKVKRDDERRKLSDTKFANTLLAVRRTA